MPFIKTHIEGLIIFEPRIFNDERGYFYESYNYDAFRSAGINSVFVQDNQSRSTRNVLRGLHYQVGAFAQAKLVRAIEGEVMDVVVDIREGSPTYGESFSLLLSAENKKQLYIPRGFAHGFSINVIISIQKNRKAVLRSMTLIWGLIGALIWRMLFCQKKTAFIRLWDNIGSFIKRFLCLEH
jgi:dTDP-4-dehydrorhamnose 3,5-epimerase